MQQVTDPAPKHIGVVLIERRPSQPYGARYRDPGTTMVPPFGPPERSRQSLSIRAQCVQRRGGRPKPSISACISPAEAEADLYAALETDAMAADPQPTNLRQTRRGSTRCEYTCKVGVSEPDRFTDNPIHQMSGPNT